MTDSFKKPVRARLAPSPTGPFHIGTARTALFNWLFARQKNGKFILRIEDTDIERSDKKFEDDIIDGLKWLGLDWDEGLYRQSERLDIYEKYLKQLLDNDKAYYCFCTKEELEEERQAQLSQGLPPRYSGRCRPKGANLATHSGAGRNLPAEKINPHTFSLSIKPNEKNSKHPFTAVRPHNIQEGVGIKEKNAAIDSVIRFSMPEAEIVFKDLIRGQVKFNAGLFGDIVIAKDLRTPLYNFAAVVDDETMQISHVIRGEDHLSNTPKQILLQQALGFSQPVYAHLPLILNSDRSKLSKRFNAVSVDDYRTAGYLPEAILNFLAFLGWHPAGDNEFLNREALIKEFSLSRVQKAGAIFNQEKLDWLNSQHIKNLDINELVERTAPFAKSVGWTGDREFLSRVVKIEKERLKRLSDFPVSAGFFFKLTDYDRKLLIWPRQISKDEALAGGQDLRQEQIADNLKILKEILEKTPEQKFTQADLIVVLEEAVKSDKGAFLWPLRVALSGLNVSPGPFEIMEVLGKIESLRRLDLAIQKFGG